MAAYLSTFAAVGVTRMSSRRYWGVLSASYTPRIFIWSSTVTGSMGMPKVNMWKIVSKISRLRSR